jgi:hypothetical protein
MESDDAAELVDLEDALRRDMLTLTGAAVVVSA